MYCTDIDINETWLKFLDFRNYTEYDNAVKNIKPDYLFHIGAYTDLEYCELNKKDALETNFYSVKNAVKISNIYNCQLIFISSLVFLMEQKIHIMMKIYLYLLATMLKQKL